MKIENISDLRVLLQTAQTGSLTRAAAVLGITPAAEAAAPSWPVVWLRRIGYLLAGVGVTLLIGHRHWAGPLPAVPSAPPSDPVTVTVPPADPPPVPSPAPAAAQEAPAATEPGAADETPEEDTSLLRALIRAGRLSDHEADFYHQVTEDD